jgi:hypothetical protein
MSKVSERVDALWKFATEGDESLSAVEDTIAALHAVLVTRIFSLLVVCPDVRERLPVRVIGEIKGDDKSGVFGSLMTVEFLTGDDPDCNDEVVITVGDARGTKH